MKRGAYRGLAGLTQRETAKVLGISYGTVQRIEAEAIRKLRRLLLGKVEVSQIEKGN